MTRRRRRVKCVDRDAMLNQLLRNQHTIMRALALLDCRSGFMTHDLEDRVQETMGLIGEPEPPTRREP